MEENRNPNPESVPEIIPEVIPEVKPEPICVPKPEPALIARGREFAFGGGVLLLSILMCNFVFYGGFHLAFGIMAAAAIAISWAYLHTSGHRFGGYEKALLILSIVICLGFGRSDDGGLKFVMLLFLFVTVNLALCIGAKQNRRSPDGAMSLLDAPRAFYRMGIGNTGRAAAGLTAGFRQGGTTTRRISAVGTGLLISVPILGIMISLLMNADAAFEGLMDLLPDFELEEYLISAMWGIILAVILYSRGVSLAKSGKPMEARREGKGMNALTVNTVLIMVCLLYVVYLLSQLAYFSGGLSGILPEEYTLAEYARRGFFEMAWLCCLNLTILCGTIWLIRQEKLPRLTKIAGTFLGAITVFLVITASAKMFLYIGSYGLTRRRVMTEVIMLWLSLTTVLVTVRLFRPKFGYMKAVVLTAMVLGTLVFWVDVDTVVAGYNVKAYRSGELETVDVSHIGELSAAGIPWLVELAEDEDLEVAQKALDILDRELRYRTDYAIDDFRGWNFNRARAVSLVVDYRALRTEQIRAYLTEKLELPVTFGSLVVDRGNTFAPGGERNFLRLDFTPEEAERFAQQLEAAGWEKLPFPARLNILLAGKESVFLNLNSYFSIPSQREGRWLFIDQHPDAETVTELDDREGCRYILAWYDAEARRLYYFDTDTLGK